MADDPVSDQTMGWLVEQAETTLRDSGAADRLADATPEDWENLLGVISEKALRDGVTLPDGWQDALAARRDGERLRADADDTRLAEQGEVFSREDDA